jgi:4-diphosphocytidyl-2-C-methyl-D-erythritol kinase
MSLAALYDVPAPAKLNLFLHVVGRRPDGYHLLQSVFVLIDWCDTLHFERRHDGLLQRHDLGPALPPDDLSLRAARALQQASGCALGADRSVQKRVPWGAGLGGGSSDAASTLLALNRLWGLNWTRARLQQIALPLGADVPFFVGGRNAFVEGIGERLHPLPPSVLPQQDYAVVKPAAAVATAAIFRSANLARDSEAATVMSFLTDAGLGEKLATGYGRNDLQGPAQVSCPAVLEVADWLKTQFGNSRMSGSGSAVFARVDRRCDVGSAKNMGTGFSKAGSTASFAQGIPPLPSGWTGRMCRSLGHHPLVGWAD